MRFTNDTIFVLTQNVGNNPYWRKVHGLNVYAINSNFEVQWKYSSRKSDIAVYAVSFTDQNTPEIVFKVEITEGSTMVYNVYHIYLNKSGEFVKTIYISSMNRNSPTPDEFLESLFK